MDIRKIVEAAKAQDWAVTPAGNCHLRFYDPTGSYCGEMPSTPSSATSIRNNLAKLKRNGLIFPIDKKRAKALARRGAAA